MQPKEDRKETGPDNPRGGDEPIFINSVILKRNGKRYHCNSNNLNLKVGTQCIIEAKKEKEFGVVAASKTKVLDKKGKGYAYTILREATKEDLECLQKNEQLEKEAFSYCQSKIAKYKIDMKLSCVEFDFYAEKGTFYFSAEGRVDFRALVRDLANHFKTKIEMWQIGVRDKARMLGGCGICGKSLCCNSFLQDFEPITIKIAKDQDLSLKSTNIMGICGRLMCCLAYEHKYYRDFKKVAPRVGSKVNTPKGKGKIKKVAPLTEEVVVELETGETINVKVEEIRGSNPPCKKEGCRGETSQDRE
ncbi:MAG: stage 0 sporulation protein [Nitrospinae bacterium]|nr:stage 0 sporulation protein [Nitrospinota bacterium]